MKNTSKRDRKRQTRGSVRASIPVSISEVRKTYASVGEKAGLSEQSIGTMIDAAIAAHTSNPYFADDQALSSTTGWMVSLEKGNTRDMRGAYFITRRDDHGRPVEWLPYKDIIEQADKAFGEGTGDDAWEQIYHLNEAANRKRIGPKGLFKPASEDMAEKVDAIWSPKSFSGNSKYLEEALGMHRALFPKGSIQLISIKRAATSLPQGSTYHEDSIKSLDPTTNSGPPWAKKRWSPFGYRSKASKAYQRSLEVYDYYVDLAKQYLEVLRSGKPVRFRSLAHQRLTQRGLDQLSDSKSKRLVVAMEKTDAILSKMFNANLIPAKRFLRPFEGSAATFCALMDAPAVDETMQVMFQENGNHPILSTDFSGFDQTMVPDIMMRIAENWAYWVRGGDWIVPYMESVLYHTNILSPVGFWDDAESSMKSGSGITNSMDSDYNIVNTFYGIASGAFRIKNAAYQGDDAVLSGDDVTPEVFEQVSMDMNLSASKDKQFMEDGYIHYLQRLHIQGQVGGIYSLYRILGSIVSYERFKFRPEDWNPYLEMVQTLSRLENGAFNPRIEDFVNFIADNDRYELGRDLTPEQVTERAGGLWTDVLAYVGTETINAQTSALKEKAFARSAINRVLRGEQLHPLGSRERFLDVYGEARVKAAERLLAGGAETT